MKYTGWRAQPTNSIRLTVGITASEGVGVYIGLDRDTASIFQREGKNLIKLEFSLDHPLVVTREPTYILSEDDRILEPLKLSDSVWLKACKVAYHKASRVENGGRGFDYPNGERVGEFLTSYLKEVGYDGVILNYGVGHRWAVVFDPAQVRVVERRKRTSAHVSRLARVLAQLRVGLQMDTKPLGWEDHQILEFLDKYPQGLTLEQIGHQLGHNASQAVSKLFQWGYLDRLPGQKYRTMGIYASVR